MKDIFDCRTDHPDLLKLFDSRGPDSPVLWAVFEGRHSGHAVVDDLHHPKDCVLRTGSALTFCSRKINHAFLEAAIASFLQDGSVWLIWPPTGGDIVGIPNLGVDAKEKKAIPRLEFYDADPGSEILAGLRQRLPSGFEIRPIDQLLLAQCEWRSDIEFFCGSLENFLTHDMGLCMMKGDEIIVEAYVTSFGNGKAEIGAVTREAYRGNGYAPIACAYLIQACALRGTQAVWSCDVDNLASIRVARKLGFRVERRYLTIEYA